MLHIVSQPLDDRSANIRKQCISSKAFVPPKMFVPFNHSVESIRVGRNHLYLS